MIDIGNSSIKSFSKAVKAILSKSKPKPVDLAKGISNTIIEKHDSVLPKEMRNLGYGARFFDVDGAWQWMEKFSGFRSGTK